MRKEKGVSYGDTIDEMDFLYLAKVTKLNVAALAAIALAPPPPEPTVLGAVSTDTTVTWPQVSDVWHYIVRWRRTSVGPNWENALRVGRPKECGLASHTTFDIEEKAGSVEITSGWTFPPCKAVLQGVRVDDWVFGVSSVSADELRKPGCIRGAGWRVQAFRAAAARREEVTRQPRPADPPADPRLHRDLGHTRRQARDRARVRASRQ